MKPLIAITIGDFNGIGPEIALKAALHPAIIKICRPLLVGPYHVFDHAAKQFKIKARPVKVSLPLLLKGALPVIDVADGIGADIQYGIPTKVSGRSAGVAIEKAVELCVQKKVQAMVTAPASKEALNLAGYSFPGQTEMVALLSRSQRVAMMFVSDVLRIGLVTIHSPVKDILSGITKEKIVEKISIVDEMLKVDLGIKKPRLALLALNPHAGEHGLLGEEESSLLNPSLAEAQNAGIDIKGPFPADAFFGTHVYKRYDAVIAMYHDQGLIPLKMLAFEKGVNVSAGLKIVRTSPDHGTAYEDRKSVV